MPRTKSLALSFLLFTMACEGNEPETRHVTHYNQNGEVVFEGEVNTGARVRAANNRDLALTLGWCFLTVGLGCGGQLR
ncbi:hypothetical protein BOA8489_02154 [Boseongicola aestuarii]|uniref:Uncharacterized protein n=1 Tax=Boseongicola aestuarii TaxID=1470561 RepID=A0A238IZZ1_9RHOB|nr:hypothetical protein BOA8489_02154 [Boseongicola aestuarii]